MRPNIAGFAIGIILCLILPVGLLSMIAPPKPLLRWLSGAVLRIPVEWQDSSYQEGSLKLTNVKYAFPLGRIEVGAALIRGGIAQSALRGHWDAELMDIWVMPLDPRQPRMNFVSGKTAWQSRSKVIELKNWTSKLARFDAEIRLDQFGRLAAADIRGDADPSELTKLLSGFKILKTDVSAERKTFHLSYSKGLLRILVNEKPFFNASWQGNVNF